MSSARIFQDPGVVTHVSGALTLVAAAWSDMDQPLLMWLEADSNAKRHSLMWSRSE